MQTYKVQADIFDPSYPIFGVSHMKRTDVITMRAANINNLRKNLILRFWPKNPYNHPIIHVFADNVHLGVLSINDRLTGTITWRNHNENTENVVIADTGRLTKRL